MCDTKTTFRDSLLAIAALYTDDDGVAAMVQELTMAMLDRGQLSRLMDIWHCKLRRYYDRCMCMDPTVIGEMQQAFPQLAGMNIVGKVCGADEEFVWNKIILCNAMAGQRVQQSKRPSFIHRLTGKLAARRLGGEDK